MIVISRQNTLNSKVKYSAKNRTKIQGLSYAFLQQNNKKKPKWFESATIFAKRQLRLSK